MAKKEQDKQPSAQAPVRTRVAPSPTGAPHLGIAYVALFNWCFARKHGGAFLFRCEDSDQARTVPGAEQSIMDALRWLGLDWDEGPDVGGAHGPYRQSERDVYLKYALRLVEEGHAFYCFATPEELDQMRAVQQKAGQPVRYDGRGLQIEAAEVRRRLDAGEPHVIRLKIPASGSCEFHDLLRGAIRVDWSQVDMQVLLKADGSPTYHLASVVDDHLMGISHVIRGEEWINSAPKHQLLYRALGWQMPLLCHLPLLRNPDKSKLSKRRNPTSIGYYRRMGFLPEALRNYLGRMGFSLPDEREKFSLEEMVEAFDLQRISTTAPIFDMDKLRWLNGQWLRELSAEDFAARLEEWGCNRTNLQRLLPHVQPRVATLGEVAPQLLFLFSGQPLITAQSFPTSPLDAEQQLRILQFTQWRLESLWDWRRDALWEHISKLAGALEHPVARFLTPLFVALSGKRSALPLMEAMEFLGRDLCLARLAEGVRVLGGLSKKQRKQWQKDFAALPAA